MESKIVKILSILLITILTIMGSMTYSNASTTTYYYIGVNRSPRISTDATNSKYMYFTIRDNSGVSKSNVTVEIYDTSNGAFKTLGSKYYNFSVSSSTKIKLKIDASVFSTSSTKKIRIITKDNDGLTLRATYVIKRYSSKTNDKYFSVKAPATISSESSEYAKKSNTTSKKSIEYTISKSSGIKSIEIYDMNSNSSKAVVNKTYSNSNTTSYTFKPVLNDYTAKNGVYKIKFRIVGVDGTIRNEVQKLQVKSYSEDDDDDDSIDYDSLDRVN